MRKGNLLFSAVQLIFSLLIVLLGLFFIGLQEAPHLRYHLSLQLSDPSFSFSKVGYLILIAGLFLLIGFSAMYRGRYYRVRMGSNRTSVDPDLIRQAVHSYWVQHYPHKHNVIQVRVNRLQKLELIFEWEEMPFEEQEALLMRVEKDLAELFSSQFDYRRDFKLSVLCNP